MSETTVSTAPNRKALDGGASKHSRGGRFRHWSRWAPHAATVWAFGYGLVALGWAYTGSGFPMGTNDPESEMSLLSGMSADVGAVLFAAAALAAGAVGVAMANIRRLAHGSWRTATIAFGTLLSAALLLVVPDTRLLALIGYLPMAAVMTPFDAGMRSDFADAITPLLANQAVAVVGGLLWAAATLVFARRTAGTCDRCGRGARQASWSTAAAAASWGRVPVYVAAVIPALYAITRWIWVAGFPLGISEDFHAEGMADGSLWAGAWLASFALVGTVLTLGLVQRWGEVFPRWMPLLSGRTVPVGLAVVPASLVSVVVTSGGLGMVKSLIGGAIELDSETWAMAGPALLWPLWGLALAAGTLAYYLRRRGMCGSCGLG